LEAVTIADLWPIWPYQLSGFFRSRIWLYRFWGLSYR